MKIEPPEDNEMEYEFDKLQDAGLDNDERRYDCE